VTRVEQIRAALQRALDPQLLEVEDDSHRHAGHEGARDGRGHFNVHIVSAAFEGKLPLARHRAVYSAPKHRPKTAESLVLPCPGQSRTGPLKTL